MSIDTYKGVVSDEPLPPELAPLVADERHLKELLRGSCIRTPMIGFNKQQAWQEWEKGRKPVAEIIDTLFKERETSLQLLDYGCANGLFARSLQAWSKHTIVPYGYDTDKKRVASARTLFAGQESHFVAKGELALLPEKVDVVYWNLWDNWSFLGSEKDAQIKLFNDLRGRAGSTGYLIIGLYDSEPKQRQEKLKQLAELGYSHEGARDSSTGRETFAWFKGTE